MMTDGCNQNLDYMGGGNRFLPQPITVGRFRPAPVTPQNGEERPRSAQF